MDSDICSGLGVRDVHWALTSLEGSQSSNVECAFSRMERRNFAEFGT